MAHGDRVELRVSQLRDAAGTLKRSGERLHQSLQNIRTTLDELVALGVESPGLYDQLTHQRGQTYHWADALTHFAGKLGAAADDIERAHATRDPLTDLRHNPRPFLLPETAVEAPPAVTSAPRDPLNISYVSAVNAPVFQQLQTVRAQLDDKQTQLATALQQRGDLLSDLGAVQNRTLSYDSAADVTGLPAVQALNSEIAALDEQIAVLNGDVLDLQADYDALGERLLRVHPGEAGDAALIFSMEGSATPDIIRDNVEGCVNHVVNRVAIPPGLARDAHLWDDLVTRFPEYGIQSGNVPLAGSVIVMSPDHSYADDVYGHLLYVEAVEGGTVWVTDNNHTAPVRLTDLTAEISGGNLQYLYFPWHTRA